MNIAGKFARYQAGENDSDQTSLALLQVRDFLSRQWRLIALVTGLSIIVGIAYLAVTPKRYTAQADMVIDTKRTTWAQSELQAENRFVEDASVESEIETTRSESVASGVARQLHLTDDPEFIGSGVGLRSRLLSLLRNRSWAGARGHQRPIDASGPCYAEHQFARYPGWAQLYRADRLHLARPGKGSEDRQRICRRLHRRPASG